MSQKYVISDHHFNHSKIIEYENRPFKDTNEMNLYMIEQWNKVITKKDIVFHLGDFCFGQLDDIQYWFDQLNGRKILVMGNHDRRIDHRPEFWLNVGFEEVYRYPIIYQPGIVLSHEPITMYISNCINIHGHMHSKLVQNPGKNMYINVGVEGLNYKPVTIDELIKNKC